MEFEGMPLISDEDRARLKELDTAHYRARCDNPRSKRTRETKQALVAFQEEIVRKSNKANRDFSRITSGY